MKKIKKFEKIGKKNYKKNRKKLREKFKKKLIFLEKIQKTKIPGKSEVSIFRPIFPGCHVWHLIPVGRYHFPWYLFY